MGKTESINDRRVDVYLNTTDQKQRWAEQADQHETSLSKFVQESVEYTIQQGGPDFTEAGQKAEEIRELEDQIADLEQQLDQKDLVIEKLQTELTALRSAPFREDEFEDTRQFDEELVEIIREAGQIRSQEIFRRLNVDAQNIEIVEGIQNQLSQLEKYGIVEETIHGWEWVDQHEQ